MTELYKSPEDTEDDDTPKRVPPILEGIITINRGSEGGMKHEFLGAERARIEAAERRRKEAEAELAAKDNETDDSEDEDDEDNEAEETVGSLDARDDREHSADFDEAQYFAAKAEAQPEAIEPGSQEADMLPVPEATQYNSLDTTENPVYNLPDIELPPITSDIADLPPIAGREDVVPSPSQNTEVPFTLSGEEPDPQDEPPERVPPAAYNGLVPPAQPPYPEYQADIPYQPYAPVAETRITQVENTRDPRLAPVAALLGAEYFGRKRADRKYAEESREYVDDRFKQHEATYPDHDQLRKLQQTTEQSAAKAAAEQKAVELQEELRLQPDQHVSQSAWHKIVLDKHGHEVNHAIEYGEGFHHEQQEVRHDDLAAYAAAAAGQYTVPPPAPQQHPPYGGGLPSGMTNPTLPAGIPTQVDSQRQLPAEDKQAAPNVNAVWLWIMIILILAAFFTAALL